MRASDALMGSVAAALRGDAALRAAVPNVHALLPPPGAKPPYLIVGPDIASEWATKTGDGREHRLRVTLWTEARAAAETAVERVEAVVGALPAALSGHRLVSMRLLRSLADASEKGAATAHILEFRARTERVG